MNKVSDDQVVLEGEELLQLWQQGREAWNEWMQANPQVKHNFNDVRFPKDIKAPLENFCLPRLREIKGFDHINAIGALFAQTINATEALALWKKGKEVWNKYSQQPEFQDYDVNFEGVEFPEGDVSFVGFIFPKKGDVSFSNATFDKGEVNFSGVEFGYGTVDFKWVTFSDGDVLFKGTLFGDGDVRFFKAEFGVGLVSFLEAKFGKGEVSFRKVEFGDGDVLFKKAVFGDCDVSFFDARFGSGELEFREADLGCSKVRFESVKLDELDFVQVNTKNCTQLNFQGLSCEGRINFSGMKTSTVLDLSESSIQRPVNFDDTNINYRKTSLQDVKSQSKNTSVWLRYLLRCAESKNDESAFRRLKKLAKDAEDHDSALNFFAKEKRSSYLHRLPLYSPKLWIYCFYGFFSNYGRSIFTPLIALCVSWLIFSFIYLGYSHSSYDRSCDQRVSLLRCEFVSVVKFSPLSTVFTDYHEKHCIDVCPVFASAQNFSASKTIPFLSSANNAKDSAIRAMFGYDIDPNDPHPQLREHIDIPMEVHSWARVQNVVSMMLLSLLVIAIRNRFRA